MGEAELSYYQNDDLLATAAAEQWLSAIEETHRPDRKYLVALSGGRIAKKFFAEVERMASRDSLAHIEFFWADERCVPSGDLESNFRLADEHLFRPLNIASQAIHRIAGELAPKEAAMAASEDLIKHASGNAGVMPVLDMVLLGMGEDGHVASLFPRDLGTSLNRRSVFLPVENAPKPPPKRVTLGYGPIYAARNVWVLASGEGKEAALKESLSSSGRTPLAKVIENRSATRILTNIPHSWACRLKLDCTRL